MFKKIREQKIMSQVTKEAALTKDQFSAAWVNGSVHSPI
jgi:hypothetical protein